MNFFENYYKVGLTIKSKAARQEYYAAIVEYYFSGGQEPNFKNEQAATGFEGVRFSLDKSLRNSRNRSKTKAEGNANESKRKRKAVSVSSGKIEEEEEESTSNEVLSVRSAFDEADESEPTYPLQCLAIFNEVMGTAYGSMPAQCGRTLQRFGDKYSLDDVRAMVVFKRDEWQGTRFANCLTPNTLFSPDHFEQYMNQSRSSAVEKRQYEQYD